MRKMIMKLILIFLISVIFVSARCSSKENEEKTKEVISLSLTNEAIYTEITDNVSQVQTEPIDCENCLVSVVGFTLDKSTGDSAEDAVVVGNGLDSNFDDGFSKGFDIGFLNSSNEEIAKRDAYLCVYLKYSFSDEDASQRDSVIPELDISISDDQNDDFYLIHNSLENSYINLEYPFALVIFKGYYDSNTAYITINEIEYELDLSLLKN